MRSIEKLAICLFCMAAVSTGDEVGCLYRDRPVRMPPEIFSLWGCWGCYNYLNPSASFKPGMYIPPSICLVQGYAVPCYNETMFWDYHDPAMTAAVAATLRSDSVVDKWLSCCATADQCCARILGPDPGPGLCPALWDGWECWDAAQPGTTSLGACPDYSYVGTGHSCDLHSRKECWENATWNVQSDFLTCSHAPRLRFRHEYHVTVLAVATVISLPALVIFVAFKRLHTTRVFQHRNLLVALVARNVLVILSKSLVILDELYAPSEAQSNMATNSAWCRCLTALEKLATNGVFACMALESVYLHGVLARAFRGQPRMTPFYVVAAVTSAACAATWSGLTAALNDFYCWTVDVNHLGLQWINDALRIALLLVNVVLLCDIVRVLLTRLRSVNTPHSSRIRRTAKATLLLAPVFGVQFLFTAVRPATRDCAAEQAYYLVAYGLEGLQGPLVALLYCYLNLEVRQLLRRAWERRFGGVGAPRPSLVTDVTSLQQPSLFGPSDVTNHSRDISRKTSDVIAREDSDVTKKSDVTLRRRISLPSPNNDVTILRELTEPAQSFT